MEPMMAIIATDAGAASLAEIHGVARIFADPDGERGEFALVVEDSMTRRGIGRVLMQHLIEYAAAAELTRFMVMSWGTIPPCSPCAGGSASVLAFRAAKGC